MSDIFFFAPMRGKRTENQFSLFRTPNARFPTPVLRRPMSVYRNRPMNETLASFPTGRDRQNCAGLMPHTKKAGNTPIRKMFPANPRRAAFKKMLFLFQCFQSCFVVGLVLNFFNQLVVNHLACFVHYYHGTCLKPAQRAVNQQCAVLFTERWVAEQ